MAKPLTQEEIAEALGLAQPTISQLFKGIKRLGPSSAKKISKITGRNWTRYMDMPPAELEAEIREALAKQQQTEAA